MAATSTVIARRSLLRTRWFALAPRITIAIASMANAMSRWSGWLAITRSIQLASFLECRDLVRRHRDRDDRRIAAALRVALGIHASRRRGAGDLRRLLFRTSRRADQRSETKPFFLGL